MRFDEFDREVVIPGDSTASTAEHWPHNGLPAPRGPDKGAAKQGDTPPHRRGRDLPRPGCADPPRRGGAGRTTRRMGRVPALKLARSATTGIPSPQTNPVPQAPESEPRARPATPTQQEPPQQRTAPQPPAHDAPAPKTQAPAPEAPVRQAPVHQTPPPRAPAAKHLLRGRQTSLRSSPSDRHRPCTRRRLLPATCSCATSGTRTKGTQVFNSDVLMGFQHLLR